MTHSGTGFAPAHTVASADRSVLEAAEAGVIMQTVDDVEYAGRHVQIGGQRLLNFGSCSYLGLEQRPELKRGAMEAIERFGTQFSYSRAYLELPLYRTLESLLQRITGGHPLVAPTTTLAHIAALPVLAEPGDAIIVDQFSHASMHTATALIRSVPIHPVRHNRMDILEERLARLCRAHRHVWLVLDGLYSMLGDFAPLDQIGGLLERYPQLHLYVDDAHCTSWFGQNGRGFALDYLPDPSRVVVALSLNKAFSAGGAVLVFPNAEWRSQVRRCGGPMLFSGPMQPALLGAAVASANLHLQPEFVDLQQELVSRIERAHTVAGSLGMRFASRDRTPIFFLRCGPSRLTFELALGLRQRGIYVSISVFPAVPQNRSGIRFTVSLHNTPDDIDWLMEALSKETKRVGVARRASMPPPPLPPPEPRTGILSTRPEPLLNKMRASSSPPPAH
jgi:7-keto-8-aminopelargonate synthetase-like enzyme